MVSRKLLDLSLSCVQSFLKVLVFIITSKVMRLLKYAAFGFLRYWRQTCKRCAQGYLY